jgi:aspartate carbamoyltransferase catalytic subunit
MITGLKTRHLLGLEYVSKEEIELILQTARPFKELFTRSVKKVPTLRGKTVVNLFYEASTRTRTSFELAAKRLSADVINIAIATSSVTKGESLIDTVRTIEAMKTDFLVVRHSAGGVPQFLSTRVHSAIINAGDGQHEHPTQGLLDMFTILDKKKRIEGLKVVIVGDIRHSRVARSDIWGLTKLGAKVTVVGPPTLIPAEIEKMGVEVSYHTDTAIQDADVINILRLQLERQKKNLFPSIREYTALFGIDRHRVKRAKPDVIIMHPGPMNRGIEISADVADGVESVIEQQVTNGVAIRMAVLYLLGGGKPSSSLADSAE